MIADGNAARAQTIIVSMDVKITDTIRKAAAEILADLRVKPRPFGHLATGYSDPVVNKALHAMRNEGAPIEYDRAANAWSLGGPWELPASLMTREALEREVERWRDVEADDELDDDQRVEPCITCGRPRTTHR